MKKTIARIIVTAAAFASVLSCELYSDFKTEFAPVLKPNYRDPGSEKVWHDSDFAGCTRMTVADVKALYTTTGSPVKIEEDILLKGQVTTSDKSGNIYSSIYIQDETGGVEIKIGRSGLYNEYKIGQWVYVLCRDLVVGDYEGTRQIGWEDLTGTYETAYLSVKSIVDSHIFKGEMGPAVLPVEVSEEDLLKPENQGRYVTIKGLTYTRTMFCLAYVDPNLNKKLQSNRIFLDEENKNAWNVRTWGITEADFKRHLAAGDFDSCEVGNGPTTVGDLRKTGKNAIKSSAYTISQYFKMGKKTIAIRSSGYSDFADTEIPVFDDLTKKVNFTGILSSYKGDAQFLMIDYSGFEMAE